MPPAPEQSGLQAQPPGWMPWLQAGLTAMLAVLFVVMVGKVRQQSNDLRQLRERVDGLENSRALERTTALEQQLRSTVERLQALERDQSHLDALGAENARLQQELRLERCGSILPGPEGPRPGTQGPSSLPPLPPMKP